MEQRRDDDLTSGDPSDTPEPQAGGAVGGRADPFGVEVTDTEPSGDDVPKAPTGDPEDDVDLAGEGEGPSPSGAGAAGDVGGAGGGTTEDPGRRGAITPGEGRIGTDPEGHPPRGG
ncbi:MAG TPA: hypothetical protein VHF51_19600 [Solirubrobacteraceae bacterium]|nr:hypothetical protein [Solirubrobacteraceae bacterium]